MLACEFPIDFLCESNQHPESVRVFCPTSEFIPCLFSFECCLPSFQDGRLCFCSSPRCLHLCPRCQPLLLQSFPSLQCQEGILLWVTAFGTVLCVPCIRYPKVPSPQIASGLTPYRRVLYVFKLLARVVGIRVWQFLFPERPLRQNYQLRRAELREQEDEWNNQVRLKNATPWKVAGDNQEASRAHLRCTGITWMWSQPGHLATLGTLNAGREHEGPCLLRVVALPHLYNAWNVCWGSWGTWKDSIVMLHHIISTMK